MDRSLYPEGVEVHHVDLKRDHDGLASAILTRNVDTSQMGIISGLVVSVGTNAQRIKVTAGTAYVASGELATLSADVDNIALADVTAGALNYVALVYTETYGTPQPHEKLNSTFNTAATASVRLRVLSAAQYAALPATDPNLSNDALDRLALLGIVTGRGSGVNLNSADIQAVPNQFTISSATQPTTITGVIVTAVSASSPLGNGTLTFVPGGTPGLRWTAPGDSVGALVLLPNSGTYTLASATTSYTINVSVTVGTLSGSLSTLTNTIVISNLYNQTINRFTARDEQHRHMLGSGTPTTKNPHGMALEDIVGGSGLFQDHQDTYHSNGIVNNGTYGYLRSVLKPAIQHLFGPDIDQVTIGGFSAGETALVNGVNISAINGNAYVRFDTVASGYLELWGIYLKDDGTLSLGSSARVRQNATGGVWGSGSQDTYLGAVQVVNVSDSWTTQVDINLVYDGGTPGIFALADAAGIKGPSVARPVINSIIRLFHPDNNRWIDLWVAGSTWAFNGVSKTGNIRIYSMMNTDTYLLIAYVVTHGGATQFIGYGPWNVRGSATDNLADVRRFGTSDIDIVGNNVLDGLRGAPIRDAFGDGVATSIIATIDSATSVRLSGCVAYLDGERLVASPTTVVTTSGENWVYGIKNNGAFEYRIAANYATAAASGLPVMYLMTSGTPTAIRVSYLSPKSIVAANNSDLTLLANGINRKIKLGNVVDNPGATAVALYNGPTVSGSQVLSIQYNGNVTTSGDITGGTINANVATVSPSYSYTTPKSYIYKVQATDFQSVLFINTTTVMPGFATYGNLPFANGYIQTIQSGGYPVIASVPIRLPVGAVVTGARVKLQVHGTLSPSSTVALTLSKHVGTFASQADTIMFSYNVVSTTNALTVHEATLGTTLADRTVNANSAVSLMICTLLGANLPIGIYYDIWGAEIDYTLSNIEPAV